MIYLDVTGGCLTPLPSGIPRTTRALGRLLQSRGVLPVYWQPFRGRYLQLSPRARQFLEDPPRDLAVQDAPRDTTWALLRSSFVDLLAWPKAVHLLNTLTPADTFFITSIFPDNRLSYLQRLQKTSCRKLALFHDAIPLRDENVRGWEKARHLEALQIFARMDLVIAVSESAEQELKTLWEQQGISPAPISVLPWPVPFFEDRPAWSEPGRAPTRLLYVSRLKAVKNHATLFAACRQLWAKGIKFELELIGCEDEPRESRQIRREIDSLRAEGRPVRWRAVVSETELHRAYQRCTFTVFPSLAEGFGLPVLESLWHGRAVICSPEGPMQETARGGGCLTVDVRNPEALAGAMVQLLTDEAACIALSREAAARTFRTWPDYLRELSPLLGHA